MKRWATTDTITMDSTTLWEYYCSPDKLSIDEQSVLFLTKSSLELDTYGAFWLTYVDIDSIRDILFSASNGHHQNKDISKIFAALGDRKGIEELYEIISSSTDIGDFPDYLDACDKRATSRLNTILSKTTHKIGYSEWAETIELNSLDTDDLQELIQTLAFHLQELEDRSSGYDRWHQKRNEFRDCLKDTELTLLLRKS